LGNFGNGKLGNLFETNQSLVSSEFKLFEWVARVLTERDFPISQFQNFPIPQPPSMRHIIFSLLLLTIAFSVNAQNNVTVLKGATVIDVDNYGKSSNDIKNAVVIIKDGKIITVDAAERVRIPSGAIIIDISGKYIVPGLIDGFGSVTNQAFANAYLYMGVTSVVTVEDNRRGNTFTTASPSPGLYQQDEIWGADRVEVTNKAYRFENINYRDNARLQYEIDSMAKGGAKVMLVHYGVKPEQLPAIIAACKKHHIATIGELGFSSYREAVDAGIQSFVHTSRYTADVLTDSVRAAYANAPFGPPSTYYYDYILKPGRLSDPKLTALANLYASHHVGLMPTGSLLVYPYMSFAKNPWNEKAASLVEDKDIIHEPLDRQTGKPKNPPPHRQPVAQVLMAMDSLFAHKGARYLTGSGATAFGTLPGVSLHTELEILSNAGLTNREVIAAATNNFSLLWDWKHLGKIEAGRQADLLILSANPLESLSNLKEIERVILRGKIIEREQLLRK
jgi:predicted SpoU family rRNA methylase